MIISLSSGSALDSAEHTIERQTTDRRKVVIYFFRKPVTTCFALYSCFSTLALAQQETPIPRSVAGDKGKYYLLESKRTGDIVKATHKRVGVDSVGYTRTETNCKTKLMREMGYSEESASKATGNPSKWFSLVPGSSKSDIANFVCKL